MFGALCAYPMAASIHRHTLIKIVFFISKDCSSLLFYKDCASRTQRKFTFYVEAKPIFCKDSASRRQRKFTFYVEAQPIFCKDNENKSQTNKLASAFAQPHPYQQTRHPKPWCSRWRVWIFQESCAVTDALSLSSCLIGSRTPCP